MKRSNLALIIIGLVLILVGLVRGDLECSFDSNSFITSTQKIEWSCWMYDFDDAHCYSIVYYGKDIVSIFPDRENVEGLGLVDYFLSRQGLVNVYFGTKDLHEGFNYTFQVICGEMNGNRVVQFNKTATVTDRDLTEVAYRGVWLKQNLGFIMMAIIMLIVFVIIISTVWRLAT